MPKQVLTRRRSLVAKLTVLAVIASLLAVAVPASAAIDTSASCPSTIPSSGFTDIGGYDATTQLAINCLVAHGITLGTSATTFSPTLSVSRWQMALFLTRQAVVHGLTLGDGSSQGFTDIGGFDAATQLAINQLAQLDITQGTSATTFEPNLVVSRWQMALFLVRLADAAGVILPSGAPQGFLDIATLSVEAQLAINQAHQLGIADGFSATQYSPFTDTLRWQMALFLTRTLAVDNVAPPTGVSGSFVDSPELIQVTEESFDDGDEELVLVFRFDSDIADATDSLFFVYEGDGTAHAADSVAIDGDEVTATFDAIDEDTNDLLTVATVANGAVEDADGLVNPEGSAPLSAATISDSAPGLTTTNLTGVTWESDALATSAFTFEYDADVTVADLDPGFSIILDDGVNEVACLADGAQVSDEILVECAGSIESDEWARGIDDGTSSGILVLQAADETASLTPDLVSVEFISATVAELTFDEVVQLPGEVDDSDDGGYTGALADFVVYEADGTETSPDRAVVLSDNRVVRLEFDTGLPGGDVDDEGVGAILVDGAVEEDSGDEPNLVDEARAGAGDDVDLAAGFTLAPDLTSVGTPVVSDEDIFGDPSEWSVDLTFDEDVDTCDPTEIRAYFDDGNFVEASSCDVDDEVVTAVFDDDITDADIVGVGSGAADDGALDNPEGSEGI